MRSLPPKLVTTVVVLLLSLTSTVCGNVNAQEQSANQLDIQALLREVEAKQKENLADATRYSYTLKRTVQELNSKGEVKKVKRYTYQVFPLLYGLPAMLQLSEDDKPLADEKLAKERIRVNKYWKKHKYDAPKTKPGDEPPWFEGLDVSFVGNERYEGRDVVVLSFKPESAGKNADSRRLISGLKGQVWIERTDKMIVKLHGELTTVYKHGFGFLSSLRPGSVLTIERVPIGEGRWAVRRLEFASIQKHAAGLLLLSQTAHTRQLDEMSDYRPFDPETDDLFATP